MAPNHELSWFVSGSTTVSGRHIQLDGWAYIFIHYILWGISSTHIMKKIADSAVNTWLVGSLKYDLYSSLPGVIFIDQFFQMGCSNQSSGIWAQLMVYGMYDSWYCMMVIHVVSTIFSNWTRQNGGSIDLAMEKNVGLASLAINNRGSPIVKP